MQKIVFDYYNEETESIIQNAYNVREFNTNGAYGITGYWVEGTEGPELYVLSQYNIVPISSVWGFSARQIIFNNFIHPSSLKKAPAYTSSMTLRCANEC